MHFAAYADEVKWLIRYAGPISVTQLFYSLIAPTTLAFCGYLGKDQLDAAGLALSIFQLSVANFASAVRWGLMPFLATTMAGTKKQRVGVFVQRGLIVSCILAFFSWTLALNSGNLLILTGQDPALAADTERYFMILMPGCLGIILFRALVAYTDTTGHLWPTFVVHVLGLVCNSLLHFWLVLHTDLGYVGSAISLSCTFVLLAMFQAAFIWRLRLYKGTWSGWSTRAFVGWAKFFKTMLPCIGTQTLWIFGTEVGNFLAGLLGKSEIAAESLLFQLNFLAFLLPVGLGSAVIARIGMFLSLQQPMRAKRTFAVSVSFMGLVGVVVGLIFFALRYEIPKIFSLDPESSSLFTQLMPYLSVYTCLQLAGYPCVAALRACNHHTVAMVINFISYYVISLPLGVTLTFAFDFGLRGLWIGFVSASISFFVLLSTALLRADWTKRSTLAHKEAEWETDVDAQFSRETQPLIDRREKERPQGDSDRRDWRMVKSKLPVILCILLAFLLSLLLRLLLPPHVPVTPLDNSTIRFNASDAGTASSFLTN